MCALSSSWILVADPDEATGRRWRLTRSGYHAYPGQRLQDVVAQTASGLVVRVPVAYCVCVQHAPSPETWCEVKGPVWVLSPGNSS